jgi:CheY-like chemotaxis protein
MLLSLGAEPVICNSLGDVLEKLSSDPPIASHLFIEDAPGLDLWDAAKRCKKTAPDIRLIALVTSGRNNIGQELQAKGLAASFLLKPLSRHELLNRLNDAHQCPEKKDPPLPPPDSQRLSILLVEDSANNRMLIHFYLKERSYEVHEAQNGREAVELYRKKAYDLILMDIEMPVLDGYEATCAIRAFERKQGRPEVPIIALTAGAFAENKARCLKAGCTEYLSKPVKKNMLLEAIDRLTSGRLQGEPSATPGKNER